MSVYLRNKIINLSLEYEISCKISIFTIKNQLQAINNLVNSHLQNLHITTNLRL